LTPVWSFLPCAACAFVNSLALHTFSIQPFCASRSAFRAPDITSFPLSHSPCDCTLPFHAFLRQFFYLFPFLFLFFLTFPLVAVSKSLFLPSHYLSCPWTGAARVSAWLLRDVDREAWPVAGSAARGADWPAGGCAAIAAANRDSRCARRPRHARCRHRRRCCGPQRCRALVDGAGYWLRAAFSRASAYCCFRP